MTDPDLRDLLHVATDRVEAPALVAPAWATARRRRARRRGAAATAGAVVAVLAVVVGTQVGGPSSSAPPAAPAPTSTSTAGPVPTGPTEPRIDALHAEEVPPADPSVAPGLPRLVAGAYGIHPDLADDPVAAAVAATPLETGAAFLGTDGRWRRVGSTDRYNTVNGAALSPNGRRAVWWTFDNELLVTDLATGAERRLPQPQGELDPNTAPAVRFVDEDTLVTLGPGPTYEVDVATGAARPTAVDLDGVVAVDDDGAVVQAEGGTLVDLAGGTPREVSTEAVGAPTSLAVTGDLVAGTAGSGADLRVFLADRATLRPLATLPVYRADRILDDSLIGVLGVTREGTVLVRVPTTSTEPAGYRVVAWDPDTDALGIAAEVRLQAWGPGSFADDALR